jgi:hypothetical protein
MIKRTANVNVKRVPAIQNGLDLKRVIFKILKNDCSPVKFNCASYDFKPCSFEAIWINFKGLLYAAFYLESIIPLGETAFPVDPSGCS